MVKKTAERVKKKKNNGNSDRGNLSVFSLEVIVYSGWVVPYAAKNHDTGQKTVKCSRMHDKMYSCDLACGGDTWYSKY